MTNTVNQAHKGPISEPSLVIPPENMKKIMDMPIIPPIDEMLMESLNSNSVELWIAPVEMD